MSTQAERLSEKFRTLKEQGVLDIKFIFGPLAERALEDVCASVNEVLDAIEREDYLSPPLSPNRSCAVNAIIPQSPL